MAEPTPDRWQDLAACLECPPELFFPDRAEGTTNHGTEAKGVCSRCPVVEECLTTAVARREKHGVWGGAGEPTRRRLSRLDDMGVEGHPVGCRCPFHLAVHEHAVALRAAFTPDGAVVHGRWEAYVHAGCRCSRCSRAHRESGRTGR